MDEILDKVETKLMVKTSQETSCTTLQKQEDICDRWVFKNNLWGQMWCIKKFQMNFIDLSSLIFSEMVSDEDEVNLDDNQLVNSKFQMQFLFPVKGAITLKPPIIFGITPKIVTLNDMPTWARIGGDCHLVKLPWLHPYDRLQVTVVWIGPALG